MQVICEGVKRDVDAFVGEAPQFDDITMLALRYFGKENET
jgi:sigma-B regulation protein RsbU (phosphoserine phosphatase)